jgi:AAA15 family ATPase/GTPase
MLIKYTVENYKSIKEQIEFTMERDAKIKELDYSIIEKDANTKKKLKLLPLSVIYGPNASGKSNFIFSIETFKSIILKGNILSDEWNNSNSIKINLKSLELVHNRDLKEKAPIKFNIVYFDEGDIFDYELVIDLGLAFERFYKRNIISESLKINNNLYFLREKNKDMYLSDKSFENNNDKKNISVITSSINANISDTSLFLMNGFRTTVNNSIAERIEKYLKTKLVVVDNSELSSIQYSFEEPLETYYEKERLKKIINVFADKDENIMFLQDENTKRSNMVNMYQANGVISILPTKMAESLGTFKFINLFPFLLSVIKKGGTLLIDEFDSSIHSMALMNIIHIFHDPNININGSQLIFVTHNPIFLNKNLVRRDEIKFIEFDKDKKTSILYSLSDFESGKMGIRKNEDYMKEYFMSKYGSIIDVDLSSLFRDNIKEKKEEDGKNEI